MNQKLPRALPFVTPERTSNEVIPVTVLSLKPASGFEVEIAYSLDDGAERSVVQDRRVAPLPRPGQPAIVILTEGERPVLRTLPFSWR